MYRLGLAVFDDVKIGVSYRVAQLGLGRRLPLEFRGDTLKVFDDQSPTASARYRQTRSMAASWRGPFRVGAWPRTPPSNDLVVNATANLGRTLTDWAWADRTRDPVAAYARAAEGESLIQQAIATRVNDKKTSPGRMADLRSRLGSALGAVAWLNPTLSPTARATRLQEAEAWLLASQTALEKIKNGGDYQRDSLQRLIGFCEAWEKSERAAHWRSKLAELSALPEAPVPPTQPKPN